MEEEEEFQGRGGGGGEGGGDPATPDGRRLEIDPAAAATCKFNSQGLAAGMVHILSKIPLKSLRNPSEIPQKSLKNPSVPPEGVEGSPRNLNGREASGMLKNESDSMITTTKS